MLQVNFIKIYIIHEILVLLKITRTLKTFLRSIIDFYFLECSRLEEDENMEENITKDVRNLFRLKKLKKETNDATIKGITNLFRLKKKEIKGRIIRDIRNLFDHKEEDYYKSVRVRNFWSNNYIEHKSKGDRKTLSVEEYLHKILTMPKRYHK